MSKVYFYRDILIKINENENVTVRVEFPDAGTTGHTAINIPGNNDTEIINTGSVVIGTLSDLKKGVTIITASPSNIASGVDNVRYQLYINNELIVDHSNPKIDTKIPQLIIILNFEEK